MTRLTVERFGSVGAFLAHAEPFLLAHEAEHNLTLGIAGTLRDHPEVYPEPPYLAVVTDSDRVVLVAIRTPPFGLVLSLAENLAAVAPVVDDLQGRDRELPGVLAPKNIAAAFASAWTSATGRPGHLETRERIYRLTRVRLPARQVAGTWRLATDADRDLVRSWLLAFQAEAVPNMPLTPDIDAAVGRWIAGVGRALYLWVDEGRVVSLVGAGSPTPNGVRIGPVYTPPEAREHGYATALTAAASQDQLDRGRQMCFLFTDLANPTSNDIYSRIGYEPVADVDQYLFSDPRHRPAETATEAG